MLRLSSRVLAYSWASPTTAVGLCAGLLTLASGGRARRRSGTIEFHGGFARWMLRKTPIRASAMTLGHVILGRDPDCLDACRAHELVHVRQAERWGVLFLPAYVLASAWVWARGGRAYLDNPFERAARRACGEREDRCG
jgi:hypothetical protein